MENLNIFAHLPNSLAVFLIIATMMFLAYKKQPFYQWFIAITALIILCFDSPFIFWLAYLPITVIFLIPNLRTQIVTKYIIQIIKKLNLLPQISKTERIALEAGSVWIDSELFSGNPDFKKILDYGYPNLSKAEQDFMDNQVEKVCQMTDDAIVYEQRDLPAAVWKYLADEKFFGMIIPKKHGGLGFSALAHSAVVAKLATRSQVLAITVMVPNSLGPAELLLAYGTKKQKTHYLPRLAEGKEIPCFALTEPNAGSDATAIEANGVVFKDPTSKKIKIKLNWKKRYITLGAKATIIGLAFKLEDPKELLGCGAEPGITCAIIPKKTKGVTASNRHDPMGVPFFNSPLEGKDVVIDIDNIIGGIDGVGNGWKMLMESLAAGRGISLPATSTGAAKYVARVTSNYANVRKQFGVPIAKFEGIEEVLAEITGFTYMLEAARKFTAGEIDRGGKPAVVNAIAKYHFTEKARTIINHGMDILGGAAICRGPRNLLANMYMGIPIGITVEGANIVTRSLIHFGQGAIRCHKYSYKAMDALEKNDLDGFDKAFWGYIGHFTSNKVRALLLSITRGHIYRSPLKFSFTTRRYLQKLAWASASFAFLADFALITYGGALKRKEKLSGRFGDILSYMYLATCTLRRFEAEGAKKEDKVFVDWVMSYCLVQIQDAFDGIYANIGGKPYKFIFRNIIGTWSRLNPLAKMPSDKIGREMVEKMNENEKIRDRITSDIFIPKNDSEQLAKLETLFTLKNESDAIHKKIKHALKSGKLTEGLNVFETIKNAYAAKIINKKEADSLKKIEELRLDAMQVDSFTIADHAKFKFSAGK